MIESEERAIQLRWFIRDYQPKCWVVPISNVCFIPHVLAKEFEDIMRGMVPKSLDQWYFREAIEAFLIKEGLLSEKKK